MSEYGRQETSDYYVKEIETLKGLVRSGTSLSFEEIGGVRELLGVFKRSARIMGAHDGHLRYGKEMDQQVLSIWDPMAGRSRTRAEVTPEAAKILERNGVQFGQDDINRYATRIDRLMRTYLPGYTAA